MDIVMGALLTSLLRSLVEGAGQELGRRVVADAASIAEYEQGEEEWVKQTLDYTLQRHLSSLRELRRSAGLRPAELTSARLADRRDVPKRVRQEVGGLHTELRQTLATSAQRSEEQRYLATVDSLATQGLPAADRDRAARLIRHDHDFHASCREMRLATAAYAELNQAVVNRIEHGSFAAHANLTEHDLLVANAVIVYELADFMVQFIEGFTLCGLDGLRQLNEDMQGSMAMLRAQIQSHRQRTAEADLDDSTRSRLERSATAQESGIAAVVQEWASYLESIEVAQREVDKVRAEITKLTLVRESAGHQLELLDAVSSTRLMGMSLDTIDLGIATIDSVQLVNLDANRVARLLGREPESPAVVTS